MSDATYRKIVLLGSRAAGKTALAQHFVREEFPQQYRRNIDNVLMKTFALGFTEYQLDIVDTESQVLHSYIPRSYVSGVDGYIVVYSVDSIRSYDIATSMYEKLEIQRGRRRMPILLVANKMDVPAASRFVTREDGERLADAWNAPFMEVCAKNLEDCREVFIRILEEIDGVRRPASPPPPPPPPPSPVRRSCQLM